jgi:phytoene desaturase
MKSVVVIGAGVGGIAAAARLARAGYQVTVVEKNGQPGGRCDQIVRDGHRFDVGPTIFLMPEVFAETYAALGQRMADHLDLRRVNPTYRITFDDGAQLTLNADINQMQPQLERIEPGSFDGFLRFLAEGNAHYRLALRHFMGRNFTSLLDYFSPGNLPLLFRLKALRKHYDNVAGYFKHPHLRAGFTFQNMYLGVSPYEAPAIFSLLQYTELADGIWFPMGGMYRIIESLARIAASLGVRFIYNAPVKQIEVAGDRATGVLLEDGRRLAADLVVANADLPYVYDKLLPDRRAAERLARMRYTCSMLMFYWGVDKVYEQLGTHNVFLAGNCRASFDRIFQDHTLPDEPSLYVHAPARVDPSAAPAGQDTLMVLVPVGHLAEGHAQDWDALRQQARAATLERLAGIGVTDIAQHIKFEISTTAPDWQQMYNLTKGAAFGLSHNFWQVGYLRPHNRHDRYRNLYFAGASTHPGTGLPIVLLSARLTVERIMQEQPLSQPRPSTVAGRVALERIA